MLKHLLWSSEKNSLRRREKSPERWCWNWDFPFSFWISDVQKLNSSGIFLSFLNHMWTSLCCWMGIPLGCDIFLTQGIFFITLDCGFWGWNRNSGLKFQFFALPPPEPGGRWVMTFFADHGCGTWGFYEISNPRATIKCPGTLVFYNCGK